MGKSSLFLFSTCYRLRLLAKLINSSSFPQKGRALTFSRFSSCSSIPASPRLLTTSSSALTVSPRLRVTPSPSPRARPPSLPLSPCVRIAVCRSLRLSLWHEGAGSASSPPRPPLQAPFAPACQAIPACQAEPGPHENPGCGTGATARTLRRNAERQYPDTQPQPPPRITRTGTSSSPTVSIHHSQTFPAISSSSKSFDLDRGKMPTADVLSSPASELLQMPSSQSLPHG